MASMKSSRLWTVNVISFILLVVLGGTGLLNWLVLPKGYGAGALVPLRHFCRVVHEWTALAFMATVTVHILLHWSYVKAHMTKPGGRHDS